MLHFVEHGSTGGENILADGLNIVKQLPKLMYHTLASTTVDWLDIGYDNGSKFHSMHRAPVIWYICFFIACVIIQVTN